MAFEYVFSKFYLLEDKNEDINKEKLVFFIMFDVREINIESNHRLIALLMQDDANRLGLVPGDRIKVFKTRDKDRYIICELEILECSEEFCDVRIRPGQIGIFSEAFHKLSLHKTEKVSILPAPKPRSLEFIREKFLGKKKLSEEEFLDILKDIVNNNYSQVETTYFVLACTAHPLDDEEVIGLTRSMVALGRELDFRKKPDDIIVDKHCIGGVPGNRTTMLVIPIVAASGLVIPKTSSRAITSPSGTADTMETLAKVDIDIQRMHDIVNEVGACIAWGGALDLSPADDIIINVEHPLHIDSEGQMIASILSKKKSVGSTHVLIDIPIGDSAKIESREEGLRLKKRFEKVGRALDMNVRVVLSDGSEPIGNGIGPALEAEDVMKVLRNDSSQPIPLRDKAIRMAGILLEMGGVVREGLGEELAHSILESGLALKKFEQIIEAQGRVERIGNAEFKIEIKAEKTGKITSIDNHLVSRLAYVLGNPRDKQAGLYIWKFIGDKVKKGEVLFEMYASSELKLKYGQTFIKEHHPFKII